MSDQFMTTRVTWRRSRFHSVAHKATRLVRQAAALLIAEPDCLACGNRKAQTFWTMDPMGGVHGFCGQCASEPRSKEDFNERL